MEQKEKVNKLKGRDKQFIMVVVSVLLAFCAYKFIYTSLSESTAKIKTKIDKLEKRRDYLKGVNISTYAEEVKSDKKVVDKVFNTIPNEGFKLEEFTNYLISLIKKDSVGFSSITCEDGEVVYSFVDEEGEAKEGLPAVTSTKVTLNYTASYKNLKLLLDDLNFGDWQVKVENVACNYDKDTRIVSGTLTLAVYTLESKDAGIKYEEMAFNKTDKKDTKDEIIKARSNIFIKDKKK